MIQRIARLLFCVSALFAFAGQVHAVTQNINVQVSLDRDTIGLNEQAVLTVVLSGTSQDLPTPQIPQLQKFEIYSQGRSSNISITNGQVSSAVTYRYLIQPLEAGIFTIDQIAVVQDNQRYKGNAVELTVLKAGTATPKQTEERSTAPDGKTKDYFLESVIDKKNPFVNEQVTLTVKFYTAVQHFGTPELDEPSTTGFWTEVIGNSAPFAQKVNGRNYRVIERKYALFPAQTGDLTIGRATLHATVASQQRRKDPFDVFGDFFGRGVEVAISSEAIRVNVKAIPDVNKPKDFSGSIGRYTITADPDKLEVDVNQPVTVKFQISGTGNIKTIADPVIPELPDFRIYRASTNESVARTGDKLGGTKAYEQVFIPTRPGTLEIPAISFSFFDPSDNKYKLASTRPISIEVRKPEGYIASPDLPYSGGPDRSIGAGATDIRYIKEASEGFTTTGEIILFHPLYIIANGLPVLALIGLVVLRKRREHLSANVGYARSRGASREAKRRLAQARKLASQSNAVQFHTEIARAVISWIADKLNISPHGLTTDQIQELLTNHSADASLISDIAELLKRCDYARFAPSSISEADIQKSLETAEQVMTRIEGVRFE
jgi:BatD DUF11 like domain